MESLNAKSVLPTVTGRLWEGVRYFCTTRHGGVSSKPWDSLNLGLHTGDNPIHVVENGRRLQALLPGEPLWLKQVHGVGVFDADRCLSPYDAARVPPIADAAITTMANRVLAIMTADCMPVVFVNSQASALGVAHAGWRGLAAGVLEETLRLLRLKGSAADRWQAWIGPAISQAHFEVGADVFDAFVTQDHQAAAYFVPNRTGRKWMADLPGLARLRLNRAGVGTIEQSGYCTYGQTNDFFSYRRASVTGRIATVAWLTGS